MMQLADLEARGRVTPQLVDITDTAAVVAACEDASLVWLESPTNPAMEVADIPAIIEAAHEAGAYVVVDNTFATPDPAAAARVGRRPGRALGDEVHLRARRRADGRDRHPRRRAVRRAQGPPRPVRRDPRHLRGLARPARPAHPAAAGGARAGQRRRSSYAASGSAPTSPRSATRASARWSRSSCRTAASADLVQHSTALWVYATSLGGVESTLERRRRWKAEPATIPEGLIRLSVGIEDVEDLWEDLEPGAGLRPADPPLRATSHRPTVRRPSRRVLPADGLRRWVRLEPAPCGAGHTPGCRACRARRGSGRTPGGSP